MASPNVSPAAGDRWRPVGLQSGDQTVNIPNIPGLLEERIVRLILTMNLGIIILELSLLSRQSGWPHICI